MSDTEQTRTGPGVSTHRGVEELTAELSATAEELRRTRVELEHAKDALASTVSHELRTPLASIQGYVELLEDGELGNLSPSSASAIRTIGRNAERLAGLIDGLLQQEPQRAAPTLELTDVDLGELVDQCRNALSSIARSRKLDLSVMIAPRLPRVRADREQLEQVMLNLVGNALKFTPEGGRVSVVVEAAPSGVALVVTDTGIGIPEGELDSLFSRYFRSSVSVNREIQGTGLGLAVAKSIIDHHDGRVTVRSTEGVGTTVRVELPVDTGAQAVPAWWANHQSPANGSTSGTNA